MHILLGLLVAAVLLVWWARGGVIPAIMATLAVAGMMALAASDHAFRGMVISAILGVCAWVPFWFRSQRSAVTVLPPTVTVQPYRH